MSFWIRPPQTQRTQPLPPPPPYHPTTACIGQDRLEKAMQYLWTATGTARPTVVPTNRVPNAAIPPPLAVGVARPRRDCAALRPQHFPPEIQLYQVSRPRSSHHRPSSCAVAAWIVAAAGVGARWSSRGRGAKRLLLDRSPAVVPRSRRHRRSHRLRSHLLHRDRSHCTSSPAFSSSALPSWLGSGTAKLGKRKVRNSENKTNLATLLLELHPSAQKNVMRVAGSAFRSFARATLARSLRALS
jgi:hypothetical protein